MRKAHGMLLNGCNVINKCVAGFEHFNRIENKKGGFKGGFEGE